MLILDAYPDAAKVKHSDGWYPIHKAIEKKCSLEVITKLIDVYEDGLSKEFKGDLPLHIAMNQNYDCKAILYLIEKYPQSMTVTNQLGQYPIELLMANKYPTYIVCQCLHVFRESMKLFSWSSIIFHQTYKDMLARFVDQYSSTHLGLTNYVCKELSAMVNESSNDEEDGQTLSSTRNRDQSTDSID